MELTIIPDEQTPAIECSFDDTSWTKDEKNIAKIYAFTMLCAENDNAIGLAANQVAIDGERIMLPFFMTRGNKDGRWQLICNPKINNYRGELVDKVECCLTWEGKKVLAKRAKEIDVQYYELGQDELTLKEETLRGFEAQVFQHEYDHILGKPEEIVEWNYQTIKSAPKVGRNSPCPCGSGKKNKRCTDCS